MQRMLDADDARRIDADDARPIHPDGASPGSSGTMSSAPPDLTLPVAATVVLLRDSPDGPEVLLLERPRDRGSFAGAWVFPGGKVDPEDAEPSDVPEAGARTDQDREEAAARRAAVREVREETGLEVPPGDLVTTALWTPPLNVPKRIRTWFLAAKAPGGEIVLMPDESIDYAWLRPGEALRLHGEGSLSLVPPTWVTLHGLMSGRSVAESLARAAGTARRDFVTRLGSNTHGPVLFWGEDVAYADDSLLDAEGERHRLEIGRLPWVYSRTATATATATATNTVDPSD